MSQQTKIAKPISKSSKAIAQIQRKKNAQAKNAQESKSKMNFLDSVNGGQITKPKTFESRGSIQPKLKIGKPNDKYEVEADQMADKVMRMPSPDAKLSQTSDLIQSKQAEAPARGVSLKPQRFNSLEAQRKCTKCEGEEKGEEQKNVQKKELQFSGSTDQSVNTIQRSPDLAASGNILNQPSETGVKAIRKLQMRPTIQRKEEDEDKIQRQSNSDRGRGPPRSDFSSKLSQSKGSGQPMDSGTNSFMSSRFGADFSGVKIHTGSQASEMSTDISAKAFTHQNHIYFNQGQYQPNTHSGKTLLAHELTHTIQQGAVGSSVQPKLEIGSPDDKYEQEADAMADKVMRKTWEKEEEYNPHATRTNPTVAPTLQRKCNGCHDEETVQRKSSSDYSRGPPNNQITADNTGQIRRGFWDDPLGSIGGALAGAAEWVGDSLSAGVTWLKGELSEMARSMPGYSLFSVVIGEDPITGQSVERNGRNFIEAGLDVIPNGAEYKRKLEEDGGLDQAATWLDNEMNLLDFSVTDVAADFSRFIAGLSLSDITSPSDTLTRGVNVFRPYITRLFTFARNVAIKLLEIVKEIAIDALLTFVRDQTPWYPLITVVLGEDPITGDAVERNGMNILRGFILLHPEGDAQLAQMEESGSLQRAADWVDESIIRVTQIISGLRNGFTTMWETFSITNLLTPIDTFNQIYELFNQPVSELISFAIEVALIILEFIKDALIARLIEYARTIPGYNLVTVIMGKDLFSEEPVERSAINIIRGFMGLVPGGEEKFQEMQQTGAIQEALAWIEGAIEELDLTWGMVRGIFTTAWNTFSLADLATPIQTFGRVMDLFGAPLFRLIRFVGRVVLKLVEIALRLMGFPFELIGSIMARAQEAYELIKNDPIGFLKNLLRAVKQAFVQFFGNILTHLMNGVGEWLFGQLGDAGITIPADFSFQSILGLIFQILGVTRERIFEKLREKVGPERWAQIEGTLDTLTGIWSFVSDVVTRGPIAIWEKVQEQLSGLWDMVMSAARNWIMTRIITQITVRLLSMLDPTGIMAVVNSFMVFFNAVQSAIQYMIPMLEMINSFLGGVVQIAQGNIQPAADFLERTMARGMPILIGFMANQVGLGSIGSRIREVIESIQERVDQGIQWAIDRAWELGASLLQMGRNAVGSVVQWWRTRKNFTSDGESHSLSFSGGENNARLIVASDPLPIDRWLVVRETALRASNEFAGAKAAAHGRIKNVLLPEMTATTNPPASGAPAGSRTMDQVLTDLTTEIQTVGVTSAETLPVPRMAVTPGFSNSKATNLTAQFIYDDSDNHVAGSSPSDANLVTEFTELAGMGYSHGEWVRFHLINEHLGGRAVDSNLVPLTGALNGQFNREFEEPLKALYRGDNGPKKPVWYTIGLIYRRGANSNWLRSINVRGGKMKVEGTNWVNDRGITPWSRTNIPAPVAPTASSALSINYFINDSGRDVRQFARDSGVFNRTLNLLVSTGPISNLDEVASRINAQTGSSWNNSRKAKHIAKFEAVRGAGRIRRKMKPTVGSKEQHELSTKLKVGSPNDPMELEADQMADKVMRMPNSDLGKRNLPISKDNKFEARRKENGSKNNPFANGLSTSKGTGRPMDSSTQSFMENRFGADFSEVKIHSNSAAANLSDQIQAKAFTTGNNIYFNQGEYQPETPSGKRLLAHELTHTIQQGGSKTKDIQRKDDSPKSETEKIIEVHITTAKFGESTYGAEIVIKTNKGKYNGYLYEASNLKVGGPYSIKHILNKTTDKEGDNTPEITAIIQKFSYQGLPFDNVVYGKFDNSEYDLYIKGVDIPTNGIKLNKKSKEAKSRAKRVRSAGFADESKKDLLKGFGDAGITGKSKGDGTAGLGPSKGEKKKFTARANKTLDVVKKSDELQKSLESAKQNFNKNKDSQEGLALTDEEFAAYKALGEKIPKQVNDSLEKINFSDLPLLNEAFMLEGLLMGAGTKSDEIRVETQQLLVNMSEIKGIIVDEIQDILIELAAGAVVGAVVAFFTFGASLAITAARGAYLIHKLNKLRKLILKVRDAYNTYQLIKQSVNKIGAISESFKKFQESYQDIKGKYDELKEKIAKAQDSTEEEDYLLDLAKHELITAIKVEIEPGGRLESILEMMLIPKDANLEEVLMGLPAGIQALNVMMTSYKPNTPPNLKYATGLMKKGFVAGKLLYPFVGYLTRTVNTKIDNLKNNSYSLDFGDMFDGIIGGRKRAAKAKKTPAARKKKAKKQLDKVKTKKPKKPESVKKREAEEAKKKTEEAKKKADAKKKSEDPKKKSDDAKKKPEPEKKKIDDKPEKKETVKEKKARERKEKKEREAKEKDDLWKRLVAELNGHFAKPSLKSAVTESKLLDDPIKATLKDNTYNKVRGKRTIEQFKPSHLKIRFRVKRKDKVGVRYTKDNQNVYAFARLQPQFKTVFKPGDLRRFIETTEGIKSSAANARISDWKGKRYRGKKLIREYTSPAATDPKKTFSFFLPGGARIIHDRDRRFYFGFSVNIKKKDPDGLAIMKKGFTNEAWKDTKTQQRYIDAVAKQGREFTYKEIKDSKPLLVLLARFENARSFAGRETGVKFKFFDWDEAIMGHDDSDKDNPGASGYWNKTGHLKTRQYNKNWNIQPGHYWGPEHHKDSSSSGGKAPDYKDPIKNVSNPMWWNSADPLWLGHKYDDYTWELNGT